MSKDSSKEKPPKEKGGKKKLLILVIGILVIASGSGGAAIYATRTGMFGGGAAHAPPQPERPQLVKRDVPHSPGSSAGAQYQASYFEIEKPFTSNMVDADGFMQVSIGVSTYYDARVLENMKKHELPVRSAVLMTLADQEAMIVSTPQGKTALQKGLKKAINDVLLEKEGFGGIDDVYFTSFVIQ